MAIALFQTLPYFFSLQNTLPLISKREELKSDIKLALLNLMPLKIDTEIQIIKQLANYPLTLDIDFIYPQGYLSKNTPKEHIENFYKNFNHIDTKQYTGIIITGADLEHIDYNDIYYWDELQKILLWIKESNVCSLFLCWSAFTALFILHGIGNTKISPKISGVFTHHTILKEHPFTIGFDDIHMAIHSRYTAINSIYDNTGLTAISKLRRGGRLYD